MKVSRPLLQSSNYLMREFNKNDIWELTAAKVHKEADSSELDTLKELLKQQESQKIYNTVNRIHHKISKTKPLLESSAIESWEKINKYLIKKKLRFYLNISKYAAIIIIALGIGSLLDINRTSQPDIQTAITNVHVPLGQMSELTLSDGTHVWLNSGTTLRYSSSFGKESRKVELIGEAFFKVKKNETPFHVQIKQNDVEVLGTSFAAVAYPDEDFSQITLVEGTVQINDDSGKKIKQLKPRQQVNLPDDPNKTITTAEVNTTFYESWIYGEIKFDDECLADVARRMERWYNVEIRFTSDEVRNIRFTGTILKNKPIDQSMKAMSTLLDIKIKFENNLNTKDVITISKK